MLERDDEPRSRLRTEAIPGAGIVPLLAWCASPGEEDVRIEVANPLGVVWIYSDAAGESHFGLKEVSFQLADYSPPAPPVSVSAAHPAEGVVFISSPAGWHGDWHPVPQRQLMFCLAGRLEVTVSDHETRRFGPGSALLVEDTVGRGHVSRVVGTKRLFMAAVPLRGSVG
jgi:hypothetical protein